MTAPSSWWNRFGQLGGQTIAIVVVLVLIAAAAARSGLVLDLSADQRFSLHPRLAAMLSDERTPLVFVSVWSQADQQRFTALSAMLDACAKRAPNGSRQHFDPDLDRPAIEAFAKTYDETPSAGSIYVCRGTRAWRISANDGTRVVLQRELGGALLALADPTRRSLYVTQGHGELRPTAAGDDGAALLLRGLRTAGYDLVEVGLDFNGAIPADAVVMVPGATKDLGPALITSLGDHLKDGGGLLVLGDDRTPRDLAALLRRYDVVLGAALPAGVAADPLLLAAADPVLEAPTVVLSLTRTFRGQDRIAYHNLLVGDGQIAPDQPITALVASGGTTLLSPWSTAVFAGFATRSASLAAAYAALGTPAHQARTLLSTLPGDAWTQPRGQLPQDPSDLAQRPPMPLAVASEYAPQTGSVRAEAGARLVVWGSRQAASDQVLSQGLFANQEVLTAAVHWLARRQPPADIPPAEIARFQVQASDRTMWVLLALLCAVIPCACIGAAMLTWWDRR